MSYCVWRASIVFQVKRKGDNNEEIVENLTLHLVLVAPPIPAKILFASLDAGEADKTYERWKKYFDGINKEENKAREYVHFSTRISITDLDSKVSELEPPETSSYKF